MGEYKYKAFISYSHKDRKWTRWLHRRLETYPIPKSIIGNVTSSGVIPKRLKPIFRDREELSVSNNLGEKIEAALASSKNLIIICSPAAAKSKWVNQEILTFKKNNRDAQLFSVIVEGEPYASTMPGREDEECFPPALRFEVNTDGGLSDTPAEPLAADLRPHADGKRLGFLKLISGMIGVGLDDVVQRDMKRSRKRVTAITTGSLATVLAMGTLTGFALDARLEAEKRRVAAEGQIEFMLTELRDEVEKVGRLDALNVVAQQAENYYTKYPPKKKEYKARARRARVFQYLGEIQFSFGDFDEAKKYFDRAYIETKALLGQDLKNPDRVFDHAQSTFWVGNVLWGLEKFKAARPYFDEYISSAESLQSLEPESLRGLQEVTYANTNLGILLSRKGQIIEAHKIYLDALPAYLSIALKHPTDIDHVKALASAYAWLADSSVKLGEYQDAVRYRLLQDKAYQNFPQSLDNNFLIKGLRLDALVGLARTEFLSGNIQLAKQYTEKGKLDSAKLWQKDKENIEWLQNYALFCLLKAEIAIEESNYPVLQGLISEYDALKNIAKKKSRKNKFFTRHEKRRTLLVLGAEKYELNQ